MVQITEMTNWAIDLIDVRKRYGKKIEALRGVNIQVRRGEIFGLLGPNGAGKSTLVKIMMTVVRPDHALGTVLGRPLGHRGKLRVVGYLPEGCSALGEWLAFLFSMKGADHVRETCHGSNADCSGGRPR